MRAVKSFRARKCCHKCIGGKRWETAAISRKIRGAQSSELGAQQSGDNSRSSLMANAGKTHEHPFPR